VLSSEIASIASAVSGLTATVSLIYVGIQIRLSMRHTRALIQQGTTARTTNILLGRMSAEAVSAHRPAPKALLQPHSSTKTWQLVPLNCRLLR